MDKVTTGPEDNRGRQANHHSNAIVLKQKGSRVGKKDASMRLSTQVCISRPRCASLDPDVHLSTIVPRAYTMPIGRAYWSALYQPTETITPAQALRTLHVPNNHIPGSQDSSTMLSHTESVIKALSIDNLVFGLDEDDLKILLVKQTDPLHQGKWALPGGWIRYDENLRDAAYRLLEELTGVRDLYLEQLKTFGRVDRFPSERVVTIAYYALVSADNFSLVAGQSAADVSWQSVNKLPELVYDHAEIIEHGLKVLRHQVCHQPIGFNLLPEKFTLLQLQALYEAILNTTLDKPNFRRKIMKMNLLSPCNEKQQGVPHRAASLYRFDAEAYKHLMESGFAFEI